ncbi:MAG: molybdopterin-guanine dinucleotide biosynthesis protein MobB [Alphaproteobacteria bacterium]|nr:MAG: molybdopterin-guanine dinucleotide biosynthesis protein MobB [Alphaproteobacteria bacterium]
MTGGHKVFGVTGWKNAGKTTLVAALVTEMAVRGLTVSTVKHAHHSFDIDHEGTDSWKHRRAGSRETLLVSSVRWALMHELRDEREPALDDLLAMLAPCDLVLIEGYKREGHDKIEVIRGEAGRDRPKWPEDPSIVAVAAEERPEGCALPCFHPDDARAIADFILSRLSIAAPGGGRHAAE